jgi:RNA polymerase sigma-70 factor, ECF subfamily
MEPQKQSDYSQGSPTPLQEKQWVRRVREEGDRTAFEMIFRSYYKRLHGFAYTYVKNREHAEDIVQTIFLKIWSNRDSWDPPGKVKHYLFAAIRNEALNDIRHQQLEAESEEEVAELFRDLKNRSYTGEDPGLAELRDAIQNEIDQLPSRCREIYLLNRRSGLTYTEIADYLDISINTVGTQMGRALKVLRKNLSDYLSLYVASAISKMLF